MTFRGRAVSRVRPLLAGSALALGVGLFGGPGLVQAHDYRAGDVVIEHPYAPPTPPGARTAAVYLRALKNTGDQPDRLLHASSPAAASVQIHEMRMDGDVMRMRELAALPLPPGAALRFRHGQSLHLMLVDLKRPLQNGERVRLTLVFERGGTREVSVAVQTPRDAATAPEHRH